ncbi:MAG: hypothetical protein HUU25_13330, partial [Candidatus Sumerlaeia bacterium]|nr:hypothetical protein [Candidatus Sumerlaeia bacterium]
CTVFTQSPIFDDNADGLSNSADGSLAVATFIGAAFVTGGEPPTIGRVSENVMIPVGQNSATLWSADVVDSDGIARVWVELLRPNFDPVTDTGVTVDLLWNSAEARYEASPAVFDEPGPWTAVFYAEDRTGEVSVPSTTTAVSLPAELSVFRAD